MARQYAQIITAIWRDADFIALPHDEQWMYLLLNTQPDISAAGVLTLAVTRWANRASTMKPELINDLLDRLSSKRFVIVDRETDEVLVRSFIRWDKGYGNTKRQPAICDAINAVESSEVLSVIAAEADRVGLPMKWRGHAVRHGDSLSASSEWPEVSTIPESISDPEFPQEDSLSKGYPDGLPMATDRHAASERRVPQPTTHNPQPTTPNQNQDQTLFPLAPRNGEIEPARKTTAQRNADDPLFGEFYNIYPRKKEPTDARKAWDKMIKAADPQTIIEGARRLAAEVAAGRKDLQFTPYPASWLRAGGWADEPDPPPGQGVAVYRQPANGHRPSTADSRVAATLHLAAQLEGDPDDPR